MSLCEPDFNIKSMKRRGDDKGVMEETKDYEMDHDQDRSAKRLTLMFRRCVSGAVWFVLTIVILDMLRVDRRATFVFWPFLWLRWEGYIWLPTDGPQLVEVPDPHYRRVAASSVTRV